jgi:hypothetical protein
LFNALAEFKEQVGEVLSEQMNSANTMWDALLMYNELSNKVGQSNALKFRGKVINQGYISVNSAKCRKVDKNRNGNLQWENAVHIKPHSEARIFIDKGNISRHELFGRINSFGDLTTETYLLQFESPTLADAFLAKPELEGCPSIDLATANYVKPTRKQSVGKSVFSEAYLFKPGHSWRKADSWTPCQIDLANGSGVYVEISHYAVVNSYLEPHQIEIFQNLLRAVGIDLPVYGVRPKTAQTLGSGWKSYQQYEVELFNQLTDAHGFATRWDIRTANVPSILQAFSQPVYDQYTLPADIQFIADAFRVSENIKWSDEFKIANHIFESNVTRYKSNIQPKITEVMDKYPMLTFLQWVVSENGAKMVVDYLNLVG